MTASTSPCSRDRVRQFVDQALSGEEQREFETHLSDCAACRADLDAMIADSEAWNDARSVLSDAAEPEPAPEAAAQIDTYRSLLGPTDDPRMLGRIGSHEIVGILGVGGMGVVFKGFDSSLNRYVAIKMLLPAYHASGVAKQRFMREAQSAAAVIHDNVIAIHAIDRFRDAPYLVMTYVRGESLRRRLARRGMLTVRELLRVGMQVAAGLSAAHAQGLMHRDIKPANILLEAEVDRVKITDFGLARAVDDIRLTKTDTLVGTPQYMSPEQARDDSLDYRTDLFSLGSVLYEASTGRAPFYASTSYGVLRRIIEHNPPSVRQLNPDIPDWLERIIQRLMRKDREQRFSSAAEVESVLKQCLAHLEQPHLVPLPVTVASARRASLRASLLKWRIPMAVASLSLITALGLFLAQTEKPTREESSPQKDSNVAQAPGKGAEAASATTVSTGEYKIEVLGVADVSGMDMTTEFDLSRLQVQQQTTAFGNAGVGGFGGGAAGGSGGSFFKPNFGIALKVEPVKSKANTIIKIASEAKAVDDQRRTVETKDLGPVVNHFAQFENQYPGAQFLYLHQEGDAATKLLSLEGELIVVPGRRLSVTFDGSDVPQTRTADKEQFQLEMLQSKGNLGIDLVIGFPPLKNLDKARNPQERFQAMVSNRGSYSAVIEDNEGQMYRPSATTSAGGNVTTSFSSSRFSGKGSAKGGGGSSQTFSFVPLPKGRTIKAIHARLEERTGEATHEPFTLKDIPLK